MDMSNTYLIDELVREDMRRLPLLLRSAVADPDMQERVLLDIINYAKDTQFGKAHGFADIRSAEDFKKRVPVMDYEDYRPYVDRMADRTSDGKTRASITIPWRMAVNLDA